MFSLTKESKGKFQEMNESIENDPIRLKFVYNIYKFIFIYLFK